MPHQPQRSNCTGACTGVHHDGPGFNFLLPLEFKRQREHCNSKVPSIAKCPGQFSGGPCCAGGAICGRGKHKHDCAAGSAVLKDDWAAHAVDVARVEKLWAEGCVTGVSSTAVEALS